MAEILGGNREDINGGLTYTSKFRPYEYTRSWNYDLKDRGLWCSEH